MSSGEVANPITVEEANQAQLQHQSAAAAASAAAAEEEGEESDSAIGDNFADDDFRRMLHSMVSNWGCFISSTPSVHWFEIRA